MAKRPRRTVRKRSLTPLEEQLGAEGIAVAQREGIDINTATLEDLQLIAQEAEAMKLSTTRKILAIKSAQAQARRGGNLVSEAVEPGLPGEHYVAQSNATMAGLRQQRRRELVLGKRAGKHAERAARKAASAESLGGAVVKGVKKSRIGKAGLVGGLVGAGFLASSLAGAQKNRKQVEAIESMPKRNYQDFLLEMEEQELLARREARLFRNDPEAYQILRGMSQSALKGQSPEESALAMDEERFGGLHVPPEQIDAHTREMLGALLQQ